MTDKITVSVLLDQETLDRVKELQKSHETFSRSNMLRRIIMTGLQVIEEK